jgi:hypothetical protein
MQLPPPPPDPTQLDKLEIIKTRDTIVAHLLKHIHDLSEVEYNLSDLYLIWVLLDSVVEKYKVHLLEGLEPIENNPWRQNLTRLETYVKNAEKSHTAANNHQYITRGQLFTFIHNVRSAKTIPELNIAEAELSNFNLTEDLYCYADEVASCRDWLSRSLKLIKASLPWNHINLVYQLDNINQCQSTLSNHCWDTLDRLADTTPQFYPL